MDYNKENLINANKRYTREDFVFFCGHSDRKAEVDKSCLSQWYPSSIMVDDKYYSCAEQYMMAEKARMFGDEDIWIEIMGTYDPMTVKKLGRRVRNFNDYVWRCNRMDGVVKGNMAKFFQNWNLASFLLSTGDKILVEASPKDTIWGIGMAEDDPDICNPKKWKGENLLGFALMKVRDMFREKIDKAENDNPYAMREVLSMWKMRAGNSARRFNSVPGRRNFTAQSGGVIIFMILRQGVIQRYNKFPI